MSCDSYEHMQTIIAKFSHQFTPYRSGQRGAQGPITVAISGATGNVGSLMLELLLKTGSVKKIYVLHRNQTGTPKEKIAELLRERGLDPAILDTAYVPLIYLKVHFSRRDLGLDQASYMDLRDNVTHIIHSAWLLNFNLGLDVFTKTHIAGVRNIIDLALSSRQRICPRLIFLSSLSAAVEYKGPSGIPSIGEPHKYIVPEGPVDDPSMAMRNSGYGQSKYVAERIIVNATEHGLRATVSRVGQLFPMSTTGHWGKQEYGAILVKLMFTLGICPADFPSMRGLPIDIAASALIKQTFHDSAPLQYFSIENPFPMHAHHLHKALQDMSPRGLNFLPLEDIFKFLETAQFDSRFKWAVSLLEFYRYTLRGADDFAVLGWDNSVKVAPELADAEGQRIVDTLKRYIAYISRSTAERQATLVASRL